MLINIKSSLLPIGELPSGLGGEQEVKIKVINKERKIIKKIVGPLNKKLVKEINLIIK